MDISQYVTVKQAAELMKISRQEVHRRIYMGKIKAIRIGKIFLIPRTELGNYIIPITASNITITFLKHVPRKEQ